MGNKIISRNATNGCIAGLTVLEAPKLSVPMRGSFVFAFQVSYALTGPISFAELRKEVNGIFEHWKWSGDVTYRILSFHQKQDRAAFVNAMDASAHKKLYG